MKQSNTKMKNDNNSNCAEEMIRWERILPKMVLRVLLIEPDYSTRHIIAALLRNCSYKVTAVPDGLKAWQALKRKAPDIDLILTEVQLPAISGFPLLTLIMEHDICKNIPVIMMSSQDSVSMVLKCMSKGAADFLIKPVRRNELGNLWQHVWRRHIRSPPQNTTLLQKRLKTASEDNSASNQYSGFVASAQKNNERSEAQSTYRLPFLEAESTYMENMPDASQMKSSLKLSNIDVVKHEESTTFESESAKHDNGSGETFTAEESITFVLEGASCSKTFKSADLRLEQDLCCTENEDKDDVLGVMLSRIDPYINFEIQGSSEELVEPSRAAINLIGTFDNRRNYPDENCRLSDGNTTKFDFDTRLELSLRCSSMSSCKQANEASEERQRMDHSNTSAFSWYTGSKLLQPLFPSPPITSAIVNNTVGGSHKSHKLSRNSVDTSYQYGGTNQNQENMTTLVIGQFEHVEPRLSNKQFGIFSGNGVTSDLPSMGHDNVFTSVLCAQSDVHSICNPKPVCQEESSSFPTSQSSQSSPESQNSEQHCHHCDEATYTSRDKNVHDKSNLNHARLDSPAASQTAGNTSLCHDGANHINSAHGNIGSGSDGNATSSVVTKNNPQIFSDSSCPDYGGFRGTKSYDSSQREAALEKFRLKRKERCYEKKVRYQSRKRLAEQRPRVKGQFVRQVDS
ncbi:PREDICTED: two-component response regulator-like PRR95 isoform X2 [Lupinus angustifolius]|uniref:two-component response regulator-like PRR95 isoform X2 n=1 Tax=Lupinus angustifolius TaxID=3871 RepID=UPI00092F19FD|nr:PREDICTED: two-component response regulator-like PRR95 isoform X2 [Lupinus angustifolius]